MAKKKKKKESKNLVHIKKIPIILGGILLVGLLVFLILYNTYQEAFVIEIDGYMIGNDTLESIKSDDDEDDEVRVGTVPLKSQDSIYKNSFNNYVDNDKKNTVNVDYPLYVNKGLTIINYNENINLIDTKFERTTGFKNLVLSYGKIYDDTNFTQIDEESYLLLSYQDGVFINLYDIKIETVANTYYIPTNSFLFFMENRLNYFAREDNQFVKKSIQDVDFKTIVTFYYSGTNEQYTYTYEDLITKTGSVFIEEEIPEVEIEEEEQITLPEQEVIDKPTIPTPEPKPEEPENPEWQKPSVKSSELTANVYSLEGTLEISDPAGVITKAPTYTLYVNNRVQTRRTFYNSGQFVISGLSSETEYMIVGQYTYLDEDMETKKIVTFYTGAISTKDRNSLEKIELKYEQGDIYSNKVELKNVKITSSLDSESIRGVKKVSLKVGDDSFTLGTKSTQYLLAGQEIKVTTGESLKSSSEFDFEFIFYDREGNIIPSVENKGETHTSSKEPSVFLKIIESDNINIKLKVDLRNEDNVVLNNYRYKVTAGSGKVVASGPIENDTIHLYNLDPNQIFLLEVLADVDLKNDKGMIEGFVLGDTKITTVPIDSLGFVNLKVSENEINAEIASLKVEINLSKTDAILLQLLRELSITVYDATTDEKVGTDRINSSDLKSMIAGKPHISVFDGLTSNTKYRVEYSSKVVQGTTEFELDCVYNLEEFETRKKPAQVLITNSFTSNNMIDFDVKVIDEDGAIISEEVVIELRNAKNKLIRTTMIPINAEEVKRITYNNLEAYHNYTLHFYAYEYNETNKNSEFKSKYELKKLDVFTEEGISGQIELVSSTRESTGNNLVDMHSEIKWFETEHHYTIPKTVDEEGDMHIYSKNGAAAYAYDLSEYNGRFVTASFKIKAVTPVDPKYKLYFSNYLTGTSNASYGQEITNISTTSWKTVTMTFKLGSYFNKGANKYVKIATTTYGKNYGDFLSFQISGGTANLAEYEIRDFEVHLIDEGTEEYKRDYFIEQGSYNTNRVKSPNVTIARTDRAIRLDGGYWYQLDFDTPLGLIYFYNPTTGKYTRGDGWAAGGQTFYISDDTEILAQFRYSENNKEVNPRDVNFKITRLKRNPEREIAEPSPFEYTLRTQVKVSVSDLRQEITNRDYFIKVYENGEKVKSYNYVELVGVDKIENVIKEIDLEEKKDYKIELGVKIRDRYYALDDFDLSTTGEVKGISTINDWAFIQPRGNYILLNDLSFENIHIRKVSWGYRYFYGTIDFQGYTISLYANSDSETLRVFERIEQSAVLKNLVLDLHYNHTFRKTYAQSFVTYNYGTIENININTYNEMDKPYENHSVAPLVYVNQTTGRIRNFVVNITNELTLNYYSSTLVRTNYGLIEDGYVYGSDVTVLEDATNKGYIGLVQVYGGARSTVQRVYTLPSIKHKTNSKIVSGLISYETYGNVKNSYVVGEANYAVLSRGPAVGYIQSTAEVNKVYYMSQSTYTDAYHEKINETALNDLFFQQDLLSEGFNVTEMMKLGYYPQVIFTSNKMPPQPYLDLPMLLEDNLVDIVSMKILEQTYVDGIVEFNISNPGGETITRIGIADVQSEILEQTYADGTSTVKVKLTNPSVFVSKYPIRSISSVNFLGYTSTRDYANNEKYASIAFFREINNIDDWKQINKGLNQNYALMADLDFAGYNDYYINNFSGRFEGNNHTIKNIKISKNGVSGLFNQMNGQMNDVYFENLNKDSNSTYAGIVGYSNRYGRFNNVHVKNVYIVTPENKTADTFLAGALIGQTSAAKIQNCSATNVQIVSDANISNISVGGLIGYSDSSHVNNSFAQDVNLSVTNSATIYGVGGLIGRIANGNSIIADCYTTGKVHNNNLYTGGIAGYTQGSIERCYSTVNISSDLGYIGGITGYSAVDNTYYHNNLYVGNIYTLRESNKLVPNIVLDETNFTLATSLKNGVPNAEVEGGTVLTIDDLLKEETYTEVIGLGEAYDVSQTPERILPKLYYLDTNEIIPNQKDNKIFKDEFSIKEIVVNKHAESATIVMYLENPDNMLITDIEIDGTKVEIAKNSTENGIAVIELESYPEKYYDSYKFSKIKYKATEDGPIQEMEKEYRIDMIFYKYIKSYEDWQAISDEDPENYILMVDLDFTGKKDAKKNIVLNRLETTGATEIRTIKGIKVTNSANKGNINIIQKVLGNIKNINFEEITITDTSTQTNNYINIILFNYGSMENVHFNNVTINAPKENYVAAVGINYGQNIDTIELNHVNVTGRERVAGFIAEAKNSEGRTYKNMIGTDLNIVGSNNYIGGLIANQDANYTGTEYLTDNIIVRDSKITGTGATSTYVGAVGGVMACNNCTVDKVEVKGGRYVGGIFGHQRNNRAINNIVTNSKIEAYEYYAGGIGGYTMELHESYVSDSTITLSDTKTYAGGGISGFRNGHSMRNCGVTRVTVTGNGTEFGGLVGRQTGGNIYTSYVQDSIINGPSEVGGIVGDFTGGWILQSIVTRNLITATESFAGGIAGIFGNHEQAHGYMRETEVTDTDIKANSFAGGFVGGLKYALYYPQNVYSLYFEGYVQANDDNVGLASGDEFDGDLLSLNRIAVYEEARTNQTKASKLKAKNEGKINLMDDIKFKKGYYLDGNGAETSHYNYPNAAYTEDFIQLKEGKSYTIGLNYNAGSDWMRVKVYDLNGKHIADMTSGNVNRYTGRTHAFGGLDKVTFNVLKDCQIKVMYYNYNQIDDYYLYEVDYGTNKLAPERVLSTKQLKNQITWTRYLSDDKKSDYADSTLLGFDYNYFNFTHLNSKIGTLSILDKSDNQIPAKLTISTSNEDGILFDGVNDKLEISSYKATQEFTVTAKLTQYHNTSGYQYYFSSTDYSQTNNGIGLFVHGRQIYVRLNGATYGTTVQLAHRTPTEITVTFKNNQTLSIYKNGILMQEISAKRTLNILETATTYVSPPKVTGQNINGFGGIMKYLTVYDRVLEIDEIKSNYKNGGTVSNKNGLQLYYDFSDITYQTEDGYYPTSFDNSLGVEAANQIRTPLPTIENRDYFLPSDDKVLNNLLSPDPVNGIKLLDKDISEIYKVYPSSINTVNIEFTDVYDDVSFEYSYGKYTSKNQRTKQKVYTLTYDYKNDLVLTIKSASAEKTFTIKAENLAKTIKIDGNKYYYISDNVLYEQQNKIIKDALHIYDNLVLTSDNKVYNLSTKETNEPLFRKGISTDALPIYESEINNTLIKTYYYFTEITNEDGTVVEREGQITSKDGKIYMFNNNSDSKQNMNVFNEYNNEEYQITLTDGSLVALKNELKYPFSFLNQEIDQVSQDLDSKNPYIMVRYSNGYIYAFDYYKGEELFQTGENLEVSFTDYVIDAFKNDYVLSASNKSFKSTNKLKENILNATDAEIYDRLLSGATEDDKNEESIEAPPTEKAESTYTKHDVLKDSLIQVYNYETGEYELYSTEELLNSTQQEVLTTEVKIQKDPFLYNYFYGNKVNQFIQKSKIFIIIAIIIIIIINLAIVAHNLNKKEAKKA